jgi:CRP-like cAMP-binding protein
MPKFAHFLTSGIASIVSSMSDGASAEVGIWGNEGLVESFHLLGNAKIPNRCFVQMEGTALRMPFKDLQREFLESPELRAAVLQCVQSQGFILGQLAACNRLHEAEERLARWLLMVRDRVDSETYFLTQEFLAHMLGARRTTVTAAAGELQRNGLIKYSRGRIHIVDPDGLVNASCECYKTVRTLQENFYSPAHST